MGYLMGSLRTYCLREMSGAELQYLLFLFFFLLLRQREEKKKFYPKCTFFCIVLKTEISFHLA